MASNQNKTVIQSLTISLVVFVLLTFVLAITTYLFFQKQLDKQAETDEAILARNAEITKLNEVIEEKKKLQVIIGYDEAKAVSEIETETAESWQSKFADFKEDPKSYTTLVDWLSEAIKTKDKDLKALAEEKIAAEKEKAAAQEQATTSEANAKKAIETAQKQAKDAETDFQERLKTHNTNAKELADKQESSLKQSTSFDSLKEVVKKGEAYLSIAGQKKFTGKAEAPEEQVAILFEELRERQKTIQKQNDLLADLRVADKATQEAVLAATPKDNRIDGFDGRIVAVNEDERSVIIDCGSTRGLKPGILFYVYDPKDPQPEVNAKKAIIEVVALESKSLARARIRDDVIRNPILSGDFVATSLWTPGTVFEVVVVGYVKIYGGKSDPQRLEAFATRVGAVVEQSVSPSTTMLVDAGIPKKTGVTGEQTAGWKPVDETRRNNQLKEARRLGVQVIGIEAFLEMLGLERNSL